MHSALESPCCLQEGTLGRMKVTDPCVCDSSGDFCRGDARQQARGLHPPPHPSSGPPCSPHPSASPWAHSFPHHCGLCGMGTGSGGRMAPFQRHEHDLLKLTLQADWASNHSSGTFIIPLTKSPHRAESLGGKASHTCSRRPAKRCTHTGASEGQEPVAVAGLQWLG